STILFVSFTSTTNINIISLHDALPICRVSVPVWPVALSGRLPVIALVGRYPTNKLIGREPIPDRKNFPPAAMRRRVVSGIRRRFHRLSRSQGQVAHVLLTRSPLVYPRRGLTARLACVKHAASVRPEPGSNSPSRSNTPTGRPGVKPGRETLTESGWRKRPPDLQSKEPYGSTGRVAVIR